MASSTQIPNLPDHGAESLPALRHWIHGFMLQTIIYGINVTLFLMSIWVLAIHISKGSCSNRVHHFHKHHRLQNCLLLLYTVVMFALSSVFMAHQGAMAEDAWLKFLDLNQDDPQNVTAQVVTAQVFEDRQSLQNACNTILVLVNWGTVSILVRIFPDFVFVLSTTSEFSYGVVSFTGKPAPSSLHKSWLCPIWFSPPVLVSTWCAFLNLLT